MLSDLLYRLRAIFRKKVVENELNSELQFHIERQVEKHIRAGFTREEAARRARVEFGGVAEVTESCRDARGTRWVETTLQDIGYALRGLRRNPVFSVVVIVSLALGIGANTVVFGVVNGLLFRPLPIPSPEQLYSVNRNGEPNESFPNYKDIRERNAVFSSLFMYRIAHMSIEHSDGARRVWGYLVTGNYFETLGVQPALGRFFGPHEDLHANANPYAVLSYDTWQRRFGADPQVVGQTVRVNTHSYTVLGVAPKGFQGTEVFYWPEIWLPLTMQSQIEGFSWLESRNTLNGWIAGRLMPGVTPQQADRNLKVIADALAGEYRNNEGMRLEVSAPGLAGSLLRGPVTAFSAGVLLLAALVLLAACVNIASLLSARLTDRSRELAIRLSIGAGRGRIIRQLVTESLVISFVGGLAGVAVAIVLLRLLSQWRAPLDLPFQFEVNPDLRVFFFAFGIAVGTGALFGIVGALRAWRSNPTEGLKGTSVPGRGHRWAVRDALLVVQVSVCCVLITASFVAFRGLIQSFQTPLGLEPVGAAVVSYDLGQAGYSEADGRRFHERALEAISRIPGVVDYALAKSVPLTTDQSRTRVYAFDTTDFRPANGVQATYYRVSPKFFQTIRTKLIAGREFTEQDGAGSPPIAIVNETFAQRVLGGGPWVGQRYRFGSNAAVEVVGVVEDGKYSYLTEPPTPVLFEPILRRYEREAVLIARSSRPEAEVAAEMRRVVTDMDSRIPVYAVGSLTQLLRFVMLPAEAAVISLGAFGVLAIMLALTGIHGLAAYTVAQRTREIGIRVAVGARPANVLRLIFGRTVVLVTVGSFSGLLLGAFGSRMMSRVVMGVSSHDPLVLGGAVVTMSLIGIAAAWGPLRRALNVDPVQALRQE